MGKQPDVVIEFVSDTTGGEETFKKTLYARLGVPYYAIFDPKQILSSEPLKTYALNGGKYLPVDAGPWPAVGLGLRLWEGTFERAEATWLRWCDAHGQIIPTGEERAKEAEARVREENARNRELEKRIRELEEDLRRRNGTPPAQPPAE
jgi:hypothetical protein